MIESLCKRYLIVRKECIVAIFRNIVILKIPPILEQIPLNNYLSFLSQFWIDFEKQ